MKKIILIIIASIIMIAITTICFSIYEKQIYNIKEVTLSKCIDGDTASFNVSGKVKNYRFLAIDAPESNTELGKKASDYVCKILKKAKKIEIKNDEYGYKKDKYGRELVWVTVDGKLLEKKILEKGYAKIKYIYANYDYLSDLYEIQDLAIEKKLGVWNNYKNKKYNEYYTITLNYNNDRKEIKVLKNQVIKDITNPTKIGCRFIGWKNGEYLFDLSKKINKDYNLIAEINCEEGK